MLTITICRYERNVRIKVMIKYKYTYSHHISLADSDTAGTSNAVARTNHIRVGLAY